MTISKPNRKTGEVQFEFDGVFPYAAWKQNLTIQEVAQCLNVGAQHVRDLIDSGQLAAAAINDKPDPQREHLRIARYSALAFYYEAQAAKGNPISFSQSPQIIAWRNQLRAARGLPQLGLDGNPPSAIRNPQSL